MITASQRATELSMRCNWVSTLTEWPVSFRLSRIGRCPDGGQGIAKFMGDGCNQLSHLRQFALLDDFVMGLAELPHVFREIKVKPRNVIVHKLQRLAAFLHFLGPFDVGAVPAQAKEGKKSQREIRPILKVLPGREAHPGIEPCYRIIDMQLPFAARVMGIHDHRFRKNGFGRRHRIRRAHHESEVFVTRERH